MNGQTWTNACLVCGIDIINERCGCSDFESLKNEERRSDLDQHGFLVLDGEDTSNSGLPESVSVICTLVHAGYIWVDGRRVSLRRIDMGSGVALATQREESDEFRLWHPSDAEHDDQGSEASDPTGSEVHQA